MIYIHKLKDYILFLIGMVLVIIPFFIPLCSCQFYIIRDLSGAYYSSIIDIYFIFLIPLIGICYFFKLYTFSITLIFLEFIAQSGFLNNVIPYGAHGYSVLYDGYFVVVFLLILIQYLLLNKSFIRWFQIVINTKYYQFSYIGFSVLTLFSTLWHDQSKLPKILICIWFLTSIMTILNSCYRIVYFFFFLILTILLSTFYLSCYSYFVYDIEIVSFSLNNILSNCTCQYLILIGLSFLLYSSINQKYTPPNK